MNNELYVRLQECLYGHSVDTRNLVALLKIATVPEEYLDIRSKILRHISNNRPDTTTIFARLISEAALANISTEIMGVHKDDTILSVGSNVVSPARNPFSSQYLSSFSFTDGALASIYYDGSIRYVTGTVGLKTQDSMIPLTFSPSI